MFFSGTCPKCGAVVSRAKLEAIPPKIGRREYKGISYLCPSCSAVLSVSLDLLALTVNIADAVAEGLGKA